MKTEIYVKVLKPVYFQHYKNRGLTNSRYVFNAVIKNGAFNEVNYC